MTSSSIISYRNGFGGIDLFRLATNEEVEAFANAGYDRDVLHGVHDDPPLMTLEEALEDIPLPDVVKKQEMCQDTNAKNDRDKAELLWEYAMKLGFDGDVTFNRVDGGCEITMEFDEDESEDESEDEDEDEDKCPVCDVMGTRASDGSTMFGCDCDWGNASDEDESEDEEVLCSDCKTPLDHLRDGTETEGHRCNNCYWEQESKTAKDREAIIEPDYRIDASDEEEKCPSCKVGKRECDCDKCGFYGCYECVCYQNKDYKNLCGKCDDESEVESEEGITGAEFWDEMGEMFGYDLRPNHPLWSAFLLYKKMKQEEKEA